MRRSRGGSAGRGTSTVPSAENSPKLVVPIATTSQATFSALLLLLCGAYLIMSRSSSPALRFDR